MRQNFSGRADANDPIVILDSDLDSTTTAPSSSQPRPSQIPRPTIPPPSPPPPPAPSSSQDSFLDTSLPSVHQLILQATKRSKDTSLPPTRPRVLVDLSPQAGRRTRREEGEEDVAIITLLTSPSSSSSRNSPPPSSPSDHHHRTSSPKPRGRGGVVPELLGRLGSSSSSKAEERTRIDILPHPLPPRSSSPILSQWSERQDPGNHHHLPSPSPPTLSRSSTSPKLDGSKVRRGGRMEVRQDPKEMIQETSPDGKEEDARRAPPLKAPPKRDTRSERTKSSLLVALDQISKAGMIPEVQPGPKGVGNGREGVPSPKRRKVSSSHDPMDGGVVGKEKGKGKRSSTTVEEEEARKEIKVKERHEKQALRESERREKLLERERKKREKEREKEERRRWQEANRLRNSKVETMRDMIVEMDEELLSFPHSPSTGIDPQGPCVSASSNPKEDALSKQLYQTLWQRFESDGATVRTFRSRLSSSGRRVFSERDQGDLDGIGGPAASAGGDGGLKLPGYLRFKRRVRAKLDSARRCWIPIPNEVVEEERMVLLYMETEEAIDMIRKGTLLSTFQTLKERLLSPSHQIFLILQGFERYWVRLKKERDRAFTKRIRERLQSGGSTSHEVRDEFASRDQQESEDQGKGELSLEEEKEKFETILLHLKLIQRVFLVHVQGSVEAIEWIVSIVQDLSIRPFKLLRNSHLSFCVDSKSGSQWDEKMIYKAMLEAVPRVTPFIANSILQSYPTLSSLYRSYSDCGSRQEAVDNLLSDLLVHQNSNGELDKRGGRILGPQLSKRIALVFWGRDPLSLVGGVI
ncbi:hypothetical protein IE53DRAFT_389842 [Violaceomyces palustris]|uniref:Uncharacterized protein n=1 Tax=Violaceomyces palustris TaxID=1673888 RepID=A0ACD0NQG8_9BASI|nr:hypothetical protein IE53DRAFT_389842 [Violaceomyces palustris]